MCSESSCLSGMVIISVSSNKWIQLSALEQWSSNWSPCLKVSRLDSFESSQCSCFILLREIDLSEDNTCIILTIFLSSLCCCCSVAKLCLTFCNPHGLQHTRLPCLSLSPGVCSNSCPLGRWCHPTISSSVAPFSSCLQSFPASGSFLVSQFFPSGGRSIGALASASVLPMNVQVWFPLGLTDLISGSSDLQKKKLTFHSSWISPMYVSLRCKILQGPNKGIVVALMSSMKLLTSSMKLPFIKVYTLLHTSE